MIDPQVLKPTVLSESPSVLLYQPEKYKEFECLAIKFTEEKQSYLIESQYP